MRQLAWIAASIALFIAGCGSPAAPPVPKGVTYRIVDKKIVPGIKRGLTVRLDRKVSAGILYSIAMELKNSDPDSYQGTFIEYYLPDMEVGSGAWATTHFNPVLQIRILGLTVQQEKALKRQRDDG